MFHNGYRRVLPVSVRLAVPGFSTESSATGAGFGRFFVQGARHEPWNFAVCTTFFSSLKQVTTLPLVVALAGSDTTTSKPLVASANAVRDLKRFFILNFLLKRL
jgi:hypothetical protein